MTSTNQDTDVGSRTQSVVSGPTAISTPFHKGSPAAVGVPTFVVGSVALGLVLIGYVPAGAVGASMPIVFAATGIGQLVACVWGIALGDTVVASIFGIFSGFWLSYAGLVLGLTHNWFGITPSAAMHTQALFLVSWLVVVGVLTAATVRLPLAFTAIFGLIDVALTLTLIGTVRGSTVFLQAAGLSVFAFAAIGVRVYVATMSAALGGPDINLGSPLVS